MPNKKIFLDQKGMSLVGALLGFGAIIILVGMGVAGTYIWRASQSINEKRYQESQATTPSLAAVQAPTVTVPVPEQISSPSYEHLIVEGEKVTTINPEEKKKSQKGFCSLLSKDSTDPELSEAKKICEKYSTESGGVILE